MSKETVFEVLNDVFYGDNHYDTVVIYAAFQVVRLVTDAEGKFPAFSLSDKLLTLEYPTRTDYVSLDAITLISASEN